MLKITDLMPEVVDQATKCFDTKEWMMNSDITFMELLNVEVNPAVEVHLRYDGLTLEFRDTFFDIEKDSFSTLIYS